MYEMKTSFSILQEFVHFVWELLFIQERSSFYQASWEYTLGSSLCMSLTLFSLLGEGNLGKTIRGST